MGLFRDLAHAVESIESLTGREGRTIGRERLCYCWHCKDAASENPGISVAETRGKDGVAVVFRCGCDRTKALAAAGIDPARADLFYSPTGKGLAKNAMSKSNYDIAEAVDHFYRLVLDESKLSNAHRAGLRADGWEDEWIDAAGYRTWEWMAANRALGRLHDVYPPAVLRAIPGIEESPRPGGGTQFKSKRLPDGMLIPSRDDGITALRLRKDSPDASGKYLYFSGGALDGSNRVVMRPHVPAKMPLSGFDEIRLVEGEKKADYACFRAPEVWSISFPGVDQWPVVLPWLAENGIERVRLAFDSDAATKPAVGRQLYCAHKRLTALGYTVVLETWPEAWGKGFDDLLVFGEPPNRFVGEEAARIVLGIAEKAGNTREDLDLAANAQPKETTPAMIPPATPAPESRGKANAPDDDKPRRKKASDEALDLMRESGMFGILGPDGTRYVSWKEGRRYETLSADNPSFQYRLLARYYDVHGTTLNKSNVDEAVNTLIGITLEENRVNRLPDPEVSIRYAHRGGKSYLDLADADRTVIEIDATGWRVCEDCPIHFVVTSDMAPMPLPAMGGYVGMLRDYVNLKDEDWPLVAGWLLQTYLPRGPYMHLCLKGSPGSAKSTLLRALRVFVDPGKSEPVGFPETSKEMMINAVNCRLPVYDNLKRIADDQSNVLCMLATGGGVRARKLYSDRDESILVAVRPTIFAGVADLVTANDLMQRTVVVELEYLPECDRRTEASFKAGFDATRPFILGDLLTCVSRALAGCESVHVEDLPRMADAAKFVVAGEEAMHLRPGEFMDCYRRMSSDSSLSVVENDPVLQALRRLLLSRGEIQMTSSSLFSALTEDNKPTKEWPLSGKGLSTKLKMSKEALLKEGISIEQVRTQSERLWHIGKIETPF